MQRHASETPLGLSSCVPRTHPLEHQTNLDYLWALQIQNHLFKEVLVPYSQLHKRILKGTLPYQQFFVEWIATQLTQIISKVEG